MKFSSTRASLPPASQRLRMRDMRQEVQQERFPRQTHQDTYTGANISLYTL